MVVKIFSSQYSNTSATEREINNFMEKNPSLKLSHIAVSQGKDSGDHGTYIVVVNFEGTVESEALI
jgi:hypothetical protein